MRETPRTGRRARTFALTAALASTIVAGVAGAQGGAPALVPAGVQAVLPTPNCPDCAEWNAPHAPFRIFGNSYYVGTNGLGAILVTSTDGHVLIDGALPESAPQIVANIAAMGFRVSDIRIIVNSHAHFDHAGSIAEIQRLSGATVAASAPSARWLQAGRSGPDDPQYGMNPGFTPVPRVRVLRDGEVVKVGSLALTAHFTGGHTPGGTSWSWQSCEGARCLDLVYADSQTPISADDFFYTRSRQYRTGVEDFRKGQALLERISCDILITPHPSASSLWERLAGTGRGEANTGRAQSPASLVDREACRRYAARGRAFLEQRIARERAATPSR